MMRWIYLALIVLFGAVILTFLVQNHELVTISFFGFGLRAPLAVLVGAAYVIGGLTGGALFALLRRSYDGSQQRPAAGNAPRQAA